MTSTTTALLGLVCLLGVVYWRVRPSWRNTGPFLPDSFLLGLFLYTAGAVYVQVAEARPDNQTISVLALVALASALAGASGVCLARYSSHRRSDFASFLRQLSAGPLERLLIAISLILSSLVCVFFCYVVFTRFSILDLAMGSITDTGDDILAARVSITSGADAYFAPGYVKQFRDILIPILLAALLVHRMPAPGRLLFWLSAVSALIAMLAAGQRMIIVIFFASVGIAAYYRNLAGSPRRRARLRQFAWFPAAVAGTAIYGLLTVMLGRADTELSAAELLTTLAWNILERFATTVPSENAQTIGVWHSLGPTYGQSWISDLAGVLPGVDASLSNVLHSAAGGSLAGNSPLALPADCWLAFGWPGVILLPAVYAVVIGILDTTLRSRASPVLFGVRCYLFVALPVCYSPFLFLLYGGAVSVGLLTIISLLRPRTFTAPTATVRHPID